MNSTSPPTVSRDGFLTSLASMPDGGVRKTLNAWQQLDLTDRGSGFQRNFDGLEFDIRAGMEPVTIVVERSVRIGGQVLDSDGKPVAGATVAPAKTGSGNSLTGDTRYSVKTGADGKFAMRLPASGAAKYNLVAHDGDYEQWRKWANGVGELLQTKPGDVIEDVQLELSVPCVIKGRVLDGQGKPVANHQVRTSRPTNSRIGTTIPRRRRMTKANLSCGMFVPASIMSKRIPSG